MLRLVTNCWVCVYDLVVLYAVVQFADDDSHTPCSCLLVRASSEVYD